MHRRESYTPPLSKNPRTSTETNNPSYPSNISMNRNDASLEQSCPLNINLSSSRVMTFGHEISNISSTQRSQALKFTFNNIRQQSSSGNNFSARTFGQIRLEQVSVINSKRKKQMMQLKMKDLLLENHSQWQQKGGFWCCF